MRFLSIIGLCLMALFALVQGIPAQEQDKPLRPSQSAGVEPEIKDQQQQLRELKKEIKAIKPRSQQKADKPVVMKQLPPEPVAKPLTDKPGFTLRFASNSALDRLVTAGSVTLYGMANQQAWRLLMNADRPAVERISFPGWFHEMSAVTVPKHYIRSLETAADGPGRSTVVWGVQLPVATKEAIAALTRGRQGGALVIQGNGQVTLEK
jgi:hypothetical protein